MQAKKKARKNLRRSGYEQTRTKNSPLPQQMKHLQSGARTGSNGQLRNVTARLQQEQQTQAALKALVEMAEMLIQLPTVLQETQTPEELAILTVPQTTHIISERLVELANKVTNCAHISILLIDTQTDRLIPVAQHGTAPEQTAYWWKRVQNMTLNDLLGSNIVQQIRACKVVAAKRNELPDPERFDRYQAQQFLIAPILQDNLLIGILSMDHGPVEIGVAEPGFTSQEMAIAQGVAHLIALVIEREKLLQERAEARASELALRTAKHQLDDFISILSHELRTPLTTINVCLQIAKRTLGKIYRGNSDLPGELAHELEKIGDALERADSHVLFQNRLIGDLLDVSRFQANKQEMRMERCNLRTLVSAIFEEQRVSNPHRIIKLSLPEENNLSVRGDAGRLEQVIANYLNNAFKYAPPDTSIEATLQVDGQQVRFSLRDQGPGLPPREQERIWDRFYQVSKIKGTEPGDTSMGLGLHICRNIIELHEGKVGVESEPGSGSTFWFTLPLLLSEQTDTQSMSVYAN